MIFFLASKILKTKLRFITSLCWRLCICGTHNASDFTTTLHNEHVSWSKLLYLKWTRS